MVSNLELAALFGEMAALTKIADGSAQSFRARAYEAAAKTIEGLPSRAAELPAAELKKLPGIGGAPPPRSASTPIRGGSPSWSSCGRSIRRSSGRW